MPKKAPINPLDLSTVFSIYPKEIKDYKVTLDPPNVYIPQAFPDKPVRLLVKPASWWKDIDPDQPLLEIPQSTIVIAQAIVRDYCNGMLECDMGEKMPGLFYLPGDISVEELKGKHKPIYDQAIKRQENWFRSLIRLGDIMWSRSRGNPLAIPDDSVIAARMMNVKDKAWTQDMKREDFTPCPACGEMRNANFPICNSCKVVVDTKKFQEMGLKFAS